MNATAWSNYTPREREAFRAAHPHLQNLTSQLIGLEHCRVEAVTHEGEIRRFWVGRSTGWGQVHLEIKTASAHGGEPAETSYASVKLIKKKH